MLQPPASGIVAASIDAWMRHSRKAGPILQQKARRTVCTNDSKEISICRSVVDWFKQNCRYGKRAAMNTPQETKNVGATTDDYQGYAGLPPWLGYSA
jgi:hypothetical protein